MSRSLARCAIVALLLLLVGTAHASADQRRRTRKPAAPKPVPVKTEAASVKCAEALGTGVRTGASYCFVLAGRDPAQGVLIAIPPHTGTATLTFNLHNRHTLSEEDVRAGRGFAMYTAIIGVLAMDGQLIGRAGVQSEFRKAADLYERIGGGAGPGGVKAVAPLGNEAITLTIAEDVTQVSLLGEVLDATTHIGRESATPGRPVAIVSNVKVQYRPAPPARTPARKR